MLPTNPECDAWIKLFGCHLKIYWNAKVWILRLEESSFDEWKVINRNNLLIRSGRPCTIMEGIVLNVHFTSILHFCHCSIDNSRQGHILFDFEYCLISGLLNKASEQFLHFVNFHEGKSWSCLLEPVFTKIFPPAGTGQHTDRHNSNNGPHLFLHVTETEHSVGIYAVNSCWWIILKLTSPTYFNDYLTQKSSQVLKTKGISEKGMNNISYICKWN